MDRRTTIKWVLAASAAVPALKNLAWSAEPAAPFTSTFVPTDKGYGSDPKLQKVYKPGDLWPLTFTADQRRLATALSDLIIPTDTTSPSASAVGVIDFLDEWVSAPYAQQRQDRKLILGGFKWLDEESRRRFTKAFAALTAAQQRAICDDICYAPKAKPEFAPAAKFFARYRDLTAGGFYTTPAGRQDLKYVGNIPLARFDGPPPEVLKKVGLS